MTVETMGRTSPLEFWATAFAELPPAVRLRELPFLTQLDLRLDPAQPAAESVAKVLGVAVPEEPCTAARSGDVSVLWLGPDEWLVVAPPDSTTLAAELRDALGGSGAVVDVSAQRTTLHLSGPKARALLAHGCSIDLHPRTAPQGTCVTTTLALAGVTLVVRDEKASDFWILVRSSFAAYLATWLVDACVEYQDDPAWQ